MMATTVPNQTEKNAPANFETVVSRRGTPTWELAHLYPRQGHWTEGEYLQLDTNRMIELSNGCLEFLPMPSVLHQLILEFLHEQLKASLRRTNRPGRALFAPCAVRLWDGELREPDVFYVRPEHIEQLQGQPTGMDLAIEIVSPGKENRERDLETKRQVYAEAHVPEYWIVDPELNQITVLVLDGTAYRMHGEFGAGATATSILLPGFEVSVDATFSAGDATTQKGSPNGS